MARKVFSGVHVYYLHIIAEQYASAQTILLWSLIGSVVILVCTIVLTLFSGYWVGQRIALTTNLQATIIYGLASAYFGSWLGTIAMLLTLTPPDSWVLEILASVISPSFLHLFFMTFTAVSLAHFRSPKRPLLQFPCEMNIPEGSALEQSGQNVRPLFVIVFFLEMVAGVLDGWRMIYLPRFFLEPGFFWSKTLCIYQNIIFVTISWLIISLVFLGVYRVGTKVDLTATLRRLILSILSGAYFGRWLGTLTIYLTIFFTSTTSDPLVYILGGQLLTTSMLTSFLLPQMFFMVFTAVSLARFRSP